MKEENKNNGRPFWELMFELGSLVIGCMILASFFMEKERYFDHTKFIFGSEFNELLTHGLTGILCMLYLILAQLVHRRK